jgi:uncharacterized protein
MELEIKNIPKKGRGIFANKKFKNGSVIECCPTLILSESDTKHIDPTALYNYYFSWGQDLKLSAIALGYGSLYNHSYRPNAIYEKDFINNQIIFKAIKDIQRGQEITVNYNGYPEDQKPIWFNPL